MRQKISERKGVISDFIQQYYLENDRLPSEQDISLGTGIPAASVHRCLVQMREADEIYYDGRRSARTKALEHVSPKKIVPVLGTVACGPGEGEEEQLIEYIHLSESLVGRGEFFALIAKGKSMVGVGVHPEDYVIVRRQHTADNGDIVVALLDGKNNLKILVKNANSCLLRSFNPDHQDDYPDIIPEKGEELTIQGIAVGVYHDLPNMADIC